MSEEPLSVHANASDPQSVVPTGWRWRLSVARRCEFRNLDQSTAYHLLGGKWFAFAGDSVARLLYAAALRLLSRDGSEMILHRHQSFEYWLDCGVRASFLWAPYATNLTSLLQRWRQQGQFPDVLVMSSGLWPMLHIGDPDVFGEEMRLVAAQLSQPAAGSAVKSASKQTPKAPPSVSATMPTFWMTISSIVHHKLQSEQKKQMMTAQKVEQYNNIVDTHSGLLQPSGPAYQLDMTRLTSGCGPGCTEDGIHYNNRTFDVALQQTLNALQHLLPKTPRFQFHNNITGVEVNHSEISTVKKEVVF